MKDRIISMIAERLAPGMQYLAVDAHGPVCDYAGGWADVAGKRPMERGTTMMLYSMTKTFTAAAVLQLVASGRVGLDEPVRTYIPESPYGDGLTVRHLLSQTSGIPNPLPLKWVHRASEHADFNEDAALRMVLARHRRPAFAPGRKYGYSNISYWLLGRVLERSSAMAFGDYLRKNVFDRLGMSPQEIDVVIPAAALHAKGYMPRLSLLNLFRSFLLEKRFLVGNEGRWFHIEDHYLNGPAFGGIVASGRMVALFLRDQLQERSVLLDPAARRLFYEQQKDDRGMPVPMTLGWHIGSVRGAPFYYKEGGGGGFHGEMRVYPDRGLATVALANNAAFSARRFLSIMDENLGRT